MGNLYYGMQTHMLLSLIIFTLCGHTLMIIFLWTTCTLLFFALWFLDVAFEVGGKSGVNYLVLQVHYGKVDNFVGELAGLLVHVLPSIELFA